MANLLRLRAAAGAVAPDEERSASGGAASRGRPVEQRFSLLLLQEDEYLFREHAAHMWQEDGKRVAGHLEIASLSLYFVPRDVKQPILRLPYKATTAIELLQERAPSGEEMFAVAAAERVEMLAGNRPAPYVRRAGVAFELRFSLAYACLEDVLPGIQDLRDLAGRDGSKAERAEARQLLQEIIEEHEDGAAFSAGWLEEDDEAVVASAAGASVSPLAEQPGRVVLSQRAVYFQPFSAAAQAPIQAYPLGRVEFVARRVYQLEDVGLELFFSGRASLYLTFRARPDREAFASALLRQPALRLERLRSRERWTRDWVAGRVSNFTYLLHLNREAGRSFKDLTQYPVMPWVVQDYTSPVLDLSDPATFRDLSKPIGALNPRRLAEYQQRFAELQKLNRAVAEGGGPPVEMPPFLYGRLMLRLQNGRFDAPDRLFWSVADTWRSVTSLPTDVKELIPEFYAADGGGAFLLNREGVDFGTRAGGEQVGDVALPPWACDAQDFVHKLAEALESPHVSRRLHKWIDLVFGCKSRGPAAEKADNVYHYLTYDEIALRYLQQEQDPVMRQALRLQMMEFGRTPRQLFSRKHPKRSSLGGGLGPLAVCLCLAAPPQPPPPRPANLFTGKGYSSRNIPPVSRAVFKLAGDKADKRAAMLVWLEEAAATQEPSALTLRHTRGAELFVRNARAGRVPGGVGERQALEVFARAVRALGVSAANRNYLLDSGALDLLLDTMLLPPAEGGAEAGSEGGLPAIALQGLAQLSREDDPRLHALDRRALGKVLEHAQQPASTEALLAALACLAQLSALSASHRLFYAEQGLLVLAVAQLESSLAALVEPPPAPVPNQLLSPETQPRPDSRVDSVRSTDALVAPVASSQRPTGEGLRRMTTLARQPRARPQQQPLQVAEAWARVLAALLRDDAQKEELLSGGHVAAVLRLCRQEQPALQAAGYESLAALAATDAMRQQAVEQGLLPMVLQQAASGMLLVQRPAAACVAQLCADPPRLLDALQPGSGLAAVVVMALSPDAEVQRHAAQALWHLMVQPDSRLRMVAEGALSALLGLAQNCRNVAARQMALQALRQCNDDPAAHIQLETTAAARGLNGTALSDMLVRANSMNRLSSFGNRTASEAAQSTAPSASASPHAASLLSGARHRHHRTPSDLPSSAEGLSRSNSTQQGGLSLSPPHAGRSFGAAASPDTPRMAAAGAQTDGTTAGPAEGSPLQATQLVPVPTLDVAALPPPVAAGYGPEASSSCDISNGSQLLARPQHLRLPSSAAGPLPILSPVVEHEGLADSKARKQLLVQPDDADGMHHQGEQQPEQHHQPADAAAPGQVAERVQVLAAAAHAQHSRYPAAARIPARR
eukprot:scaffold20.g7641.t1